MNLNIWNMRCLLIPIKTVIFFEYTIDNTIAFLNKTCKHVSNEIRQLENRKGEYEVGTFLICGEYIKTQKSVFNETLCKKGINSSYWKEWTIYIESVKTEILQSLSIDKIRSNIRAKRSIPKEGYVNAQWFFG